MNRKLFCALALAAIPILGFGRFGGEDVGKMRPVQVVIVSRDDNGVQLQTDTEDLGVGEDVEQAIAHMRATSTGSIFLDTAEYLLLEPGTDIWIPQLLEQFRPSCGMCYVSGEIDLKQAGEYLQLHEPEETVAQYEAGDTGLQYLISIEGRFELVQS